MLHVADLLSFSLSLTLSLSLSLSPPTILALTNFPSLSSLHFISFHFLSFHFTSFNFISLPFLSFHFTSFHLHALVGVVPSLPQCFCEYSSHSKTVLTPPCLFGYHSKDLLLPPRRPSSASYLDTITDIPTLTPAGMPQRSSPVYDPGLPITHPP